MREITFSVCTENCPIPPNNHRRQLGKSSMCLSPAIEVRLLKPPPPRRLRAHSACPCPHFSATGFRFQKFYSMFSHPARQILSAPPFSIFLFQIFMRNFYTFVLPLFTSSQEFSTGREGRFHENTFGVTADFVTAETSDIKTSLQNVVCSSLCFYLKSFNKG